jgi:hypothetical protein
LGERRSQRRKMKRNLKRRNEVTLKTNGTKNQKFIGLWGLETV